jgi:hypothetical protein
MPYIPNPFNNAMINKYPPRLAPQSARAIRAGTHAPGLPWVPLNVHDTQSALDLVTLEHLQWHDGCVLHQVFYNPAMENLQAPVIASVSEERQSAMMECNSTNSLLVIS